MKPLNVSVDHISDLCFGREPFHRGLRSVALTRSLRRWRIGKLLPHLLVALALPVALIRIRHVPLFLSARLKEATDDQHTTSA
jgi:hypothetical protein